MNLLLKEALTKWHGQTRGAQEELARKINIHPSTITQWMKGTVAPDFANQEKLSKEFKIPIEEIKRLFVKEVEPQLETKQPEKPLSHKNDDLEAYIKKLHDMIGEAFEAGLRFGRNGKMDNK